MENEQSDKPDPVAPLGVNETLDPLVATLTASGQVTPVSAMPFGSWRSRLTFCPADKAAETLATCADRLMRSLPPSSTENDAPVFKAPRSS